MGNYSKIINDKLTILGHCTSHLCELSTYKVSWFYLINFLSYAPEKN